MKKKIFIISATAACICVVVLIALSLAGVGAAKAAGDFVTRQILGMKWLGDLIAAAFSAAFGETFSDGIWGRALIFFVYDSIKIVVLLCFLIFIISYIQSYFPPERTKRILGKFKGIGANFIGALLGTVTPFCSCSSIPIFIGFSRAGISSGVTFSFLVSSPLVDLGAFVMLAGTFGFPVAIAYVAVGLLLAVVCGTVIEKTGQGKYVREFISQSPLPDSDEIKMSCKDRLIYAKDQTFFTLKKVWLFILIGVGVGSTIHNFIPAEWIRAALGTDKPYAVFLAVLLGTPMYADIFGTIPVAEALFYKGVGVGTILSFMMSVTALSVPSLIMLSKAIKPRLLCLFVTLVVAGIIIIGFAFNAFDFAFAR